MKKQISCLIPLFSLPLLASAGGEMTERMTLLVFQLFVIIFAARGGEFLAEKIGLPSVLGQLSAGIIIGPSILGSLSFPGLQGGLFAHPETGAISPELFGIATLASILLLFSAGLETDLKLFKRYAIPGTVVGLGGLIVSFFIGATVPILIFGYSFMDPRALFPGVIATATSIGVTAKILSRRRSMDSPEGVTILAGAVVDDVLGVIALAVVIGIAAHGGDVGWGTVGLIALKTIGIWLVLTVIGVVLSPRLSRLMRREPSRQTITVLALGFALFMGGIFEKAGLAMIVGAYVMGLGFSNTDLNYVIQENLHPLERFFVPIFFTVMGIQIDLSAFAAPEVLIFGLLYSAGAVLSKVVGCGIPALFLGFNRLGSLRIGLGMAPRSEVALIVAGLGFSLGVLDEKLFGAAVMMPFFSIISVTPILNHLLKKRESGIRKEKQEEESVVTEFDFPSEVHTRFLISYIEDYFVKEGFFINRLKLDMIVYQIRKDEIFITLFYQPGRIVFKSSEEDVDFVNTLVYESFLKLKDTVEHLQFLKKPKEMAEKLVTGKRRRKSDIAKLMTPDCIAMDLKSDTKEGAIMELVELLAKHDRVADPVKILDEVMAREKVMSTGMQNGIAVPHARTEGVNHIEISIGFKREGLDFDSIDGLPTNIIVLIVSSVHENDPHIQILSAIASSLYLQEARENLLACKTPQEVWSFFNVR